MSDDQNRSETSENWHGSCVAFDGKGVLILGPSGAGKSGLALQLIALGADLVADDRVILQCETGQVIALAPAAISGRIEARYVGILDAPTVATASIQLIVDLAQTETDRLPEHRHLDVMGQSIPLIYRVEAVHFPAAIRHYVLHGRAA